MEPRNQEKQGSAAKSAAKGSKVRVGRLHSPVQCDQNADNTEMGQRREETPNPKGNYTPQDD